MQPTIYTFLIVCPLVFLAGFVDAVAGGGGLISLPAYLLAGVPIHNAVATNKLSSATGTLISTVRLCKNKFVDWILVLPCIPMALLGSTMGAHVALVASDKILRYMLIPVLPVVAFYVLRKKNMDEKGGEIARKKQILICALCSLAVGCYDGFYGPGTGTFLLLLYTGLGKMSVAKASGTMKVTNLSSNVAALVVFLLSGKIVIMLGIAASVFSIAGHYTGAGMVMKNGSRIIRPIILIVLALLIRSIKKLSFVFRFSLYDQEIQMGVFYWISEVPCIVANICRINFIRHCRNHRHYHRLLLFPFHCHRNYCLHQRPLRFRCPDRQKYPLSYLQGQEMR